MYSRTYFERKAKEDEIGPTDWSNAAKSEVQCPKEGCDGTEAAFFQVQIRSADEPMTTFFKVSRWWFLLPDVVLSPGVLSSGSGLMLTYGSV